MTRPHKKNRGIERDVGAQRTGFLSEQQAIEDETAVGESAGEGADPH
jgi:hypothetical protein